MPRTRLATLWGPAVLGLLFSGAPAVAQVDCGDPDNLCTGNPCVIPSMEVALPCTVDFGPRTVVIAGRLRMSGPNPSMRSLSFTAENFEVAGSINATGASFVTLTANQDIVVTGRIIEAVVRLFAGGDVTNDGRIAVDRIEMDAGGAVASTGLVRGGVIVHGVEGVQFLGGSIRTRFNGHVEIASDAGAIVIDVPIQALEIAITAAGPVALSRRIVGVGRLEISSATDDITVTGRINMIGSVDLTGEIVAAGIVRFLERTFLFRGSSGETLLRIEGSAVEVAPAATIRASGFTPELRLVANAGDLTLGGRLWSITGTFGTAVLEGAASGDIIASGDFKAGDPDSFPNGCISLVAGGTLDTTGGTFMPPLSVDCPGSPSGAFLDTRVSLWE